jgi:histidinol-phosphate aminotransferase
MADFGRSTDGIVRRLAQRRIFVQPGSTWGMPTFMRISLGKRQENEVFLRVIRELTGPARRGF